MKAKLFLLLMTLAVATNSIAQCDCVAEPNSLGGAGTFTLGNDMNIGIPETKSDQEYTWLRNGKKVKGPLSGDGGAKSFQFKMSSPEEAGTYTILTTKEGCKPTFFGNVEVKFTGPLPQKIITDISCTYNVIIINLASSEVGVTYQLKEYGSNVGAPVEGTGGKIWLYSTQYGADYTVVATGKGATNVPVAFKEIYRYAYEGYSNGFNTQNDYTLPDCWTSNNIANGRTFSFMTSFTNPTTTPYEGSRFLLWESNWFPAGSETRLVSPMVYNPNYASLDIEFYWYHNNNPQKSTGNYLNEGVQVQVANYDGSFYNVGEFIPRHSSALPANTGAWVKKTITIGTVGGASNPFKIGFKFRSENGDNCSMDAFRIVETPANSCQSPGTFFNSHLGSTSAVVGWLSEGHTEGYEYALLKEGDSWPPTGTATSDTTKTLSGLQPGTQYTLAVRRKCGQGFSYWGSKSFVTLPGCETAPFLSLCTSTTATIAAGGGAWNFNGIYPVNSNGTVSETPGREKVFRFIPPTTGIYYLDVSAPGTSPVSYLFKAAEEVCCAATNWTGIKFYSYENRGALGLLQAGKTYYLTLDNSSFNAATETFKICKATVSQPSEYNACLPDVMLENIPANNPKEEHFIAPNGVLLASVDFSNVPNEVSSATASFFVNTNAVRRDNEQREYLDRNMSLRFYPYVNDSANVKLYFTKTELQRLVNEPNDNVADVNTVNDLKLTMAEGCDQPTAGQITVLATPLMSGTYDTAQYVLFKTRETATTYYLHGGNEALFGSQTICPGGTATFRVPNYLSTNYTYQWQADIGNGFTNLTNNTIYAGATTHTLTVKAPPTSYYGYKYRCVITAWGYPYFTSGYRKLKFAATWTGATNTSWTTATNWSCNTVPDANMDVMIPLVTNKPVVNSNISVRSLSISPGSTLRVIAGFRVTVAGK